MTKKEDIILPELVKVADVDFGTIHSAYGPFHGLVIMIVNKGSLKFTLYDKDFELCAGNLFLFVRYDIVENQKVSDDFQATVLLVNHEVLNHVMSRIDHTILRDFFALRWSNVLPNDSNKAYYANLVSALRFIMTQPESRFRTEQAIAVLDALVSYCAGYTRDSTSQIVETRQYSQLENHFHKFVLLLTQNHKFSREVASYASQLHITPKYLNYICNTVGHKTCKTIIDEYVVMKLKNELLMTSKSIQEIAYEFNFPNQSFMGYYFKKMTGYSPRQFRNNNT